MTLQLIDIAKDYNGKPVVDRLNLTIRKGELVTLIGPSGCGKTTTLKMINRIIEPDRGRILLNGQDILSLDPVQLRRGIGYAIQQTGLFPNMTIGENISVVGRLKGWNRTHAADRARELLNMIDMNPDTYMDRYPKELSGGQQQRIGVLRALAAEPEIILMDEPFGALDPITRDQLQNELKKLQAQLGKTIVFVTHDMDEALKIADRIVVMRDGMIVQADTPDGILRQPADAFVASFIGRDRLLRKPDDVRVEDVMIPDPITVEDWRGFAEALERMRKRRVDSLMVVGPTGRLLGIVTARDLQGGIAGSGSGNACSVGSGNAGSAGSGNAGSVGSVMRPDAAAIRTGRPVREAVMKMARQHIGYLPVVDAQDRLVGLITRSSLVNILPDMLWPGADGLSGAFSGKEHISA